MWLASMILFTRIAVYQFYWSNNVYESTWKVELGVSDAFQKENYWRERAHDYAVFDRLYLEKCSGIEPWFWEHTLGVMTISSCVSFISIIHSDLRKWYGLHYKGVRPIFIFWHDIKYVWSSICYLVKMWTSIYCLRRVSWRLWYNISLSPARSMQREETGLRSGREKKY